MANGHGGARPGAGRPRNAEKYAEQIAAFHDRIADALPDLLDAQLTLALGVTVQEVDPKTGGLKVYTRPPDAKAGQYLIDRVAGKPTARIEGDLDPDGAIEATAEAMQQAAQELAAWRQQMSAQLPNISSAPPTPRT